MGQRAYPFGFAWLKPGENPMHQLLLRLLRLAYREFSRDPELTMAQFRSIVSRELFAGCAAPAVLDDLIFVQESFFLDRTWDSTSVLASPEYVKGRIELGQLGPIRLAEYRDRRKRIAQIARRYASAPAGCDRAYADRVMDGSALECVTLSHYSRRPPALTNDP